MQNFKNIFGAKLYGQKGMALVIAALLYLFQRRLCLAMITFLMTDLVLSQPFTTKEKLGRLTIFGLALLYVGHMVSLKFALMACVPLGNKAFTFLGGCYLGIVEFGSYFLLAFIPLKWVVRRNIKQVLATSWATGIMWLIIAALIQGTYLAGFHNLYI